MPNDQAPEPFVQSRLEAALGVVEPGEPAPSGARVYPNVRWVDRTHDGSPLRSGEIDHLLLLPQVGLLAIETKGGVVSRDGHGRWYAGQRRLDVTPFDQAETSARVIARRVAEDPRWRELRAPAPRAVHAVAFPHSDRARLVRDGLDLGPEAPLELVLDRDRPVHPRSDARGPRTDPRPLVEQRCPRHAP